MYALLDNAASDFANSVSVDRIGLVPPADPMNCIVAEVAVDVAFVEAAVAAVDAVLAAEAEAALAAEAEAALAAEEAALAAEMDALYEEVNQMMVANVMEAGVDIATVDADLAFEVNQLEAALEAEEAEMAAAEMAAAEMAGGDDGVSQVRIR